MEHEKLITAAIGRVAVIGDLYDARSNNFCGTTIFKKTPPTEAVKLLDNGTKEIRFVLTDTLQEKFEKLDIEPELQISVMAGLFKLEGHGKYLNDEKKSKRAVRSSLLYNIQTKHERLNIFNEDLKDSISMDAINLDMATHVVVEVAWGGNAMVTVENLNLENLEQTKIQACLKAALNKIASNINGQTAVDYVKKDDYNDKNFSFQIFSDILPANEDLPQTVEEILAFMQKMPSLVLKANDGKGKPLKYTMMSLSTLQSYLKLNHLANHVLHHVDEQAINRFLKIFDEISMAKQELNDLYNDMVCNKFCVLIENIKEVGQVKKDFEAMESNLKSKLAKALVAVRSGNQGAEELEALLWKSWNWKLEIGNLTFSPNTIRDVVKKYLPVIEKIKLANILKMQGVSYIGIDDFIEVEKTKHNGEIFILFFCENFKQSDPENWRGNLKYFQSLLNMAKKDMASQQNAQKTFMVVDLDVHPDLAAKEGVKEGIRICHYKNGKYINYDVLLEHTTLQALCLAYSKALNVISSKPNKRAVLQLRCPGACEAVMENEWVCFKCNQPLEYGFDNFFYCSCGRANVTTFTFKCNSEKHGLDFISYPEETLIAELKKITPFKEMNLLILGETGVGKSTFINALANYYTYPSLKDAEENEMVNLIATSFTMLDNNYEECKITTGQDKNEIEGAGKSATQDPRAYTFLSRGTLVRVIDTPGIGDTRGYEIDKENTNKILRFISNLDELHGICILLKPNNARLNTLFRFCIKELLTHLHRTASQNIVFCFTNARSTFYRPGDTFPALKSLLSENEDIGISLSKHTMYCFDNESFRFLCIAKYGQKFGITFDEAERKNFTTSWDISAQEISRMFEHIVSLEPHPIKDTLSLNNARRIIVHLTQPLGDISKNIQDNLVVVQRKKEEIEVSKASEEQLAKQLYIPVIDVERENLDQPRTVCASSDCVKHHIKVDKSVWIEYSTICHNVCYLRGIQPEHFPHEGLRKCSAMNSEFRCKHCGCCYDKHLHLTYKQIRVEKREKDESVVSLMNAKKTANEQIKQFIKTLETRSEQLESEQTTIRQTSAKFGLFLKMNAITPYNDALAEYLDHQIREEKDKFQISKDRSTLTKLEEFKRAYEEEIKTLQNAMESGQSVEELGPNEIKTLVDQLYNLKISGKLLKQHMDQALQAESQSKNYQETDCSPMQTKKNWIPSKTIKWIRTRMGW